MVAASVAVVAQQNRSSALIRIGPRSPIMHLTESLSLSMNSESSKMNGAHTYPVITMRGKAAQDRLSHRR